MWGITYWEKVFVKNQMKDLSELRKISNAIWERDMVTKRRTEKAMIRAMCGVEKRRTQELMSLLGLKDTMD